MPSATVHAHLRRRQRAFHALSSKLKLGEDFGSSVNSDNVYDAGRIILTDISDGTRTRV